MMNIPSESPQINRTHYAFPAPQLVNSQLYWLSVFLSGFITIAYHSFLKSPPHCKNTQGFVFPTRLFFPWFDPKNTLLIISYGPVKKVDRCGDQGGSIWAVIKSDFPPKVVPRGWLDTLPPTPPYFLLTHWWWGWWWWWWWWWWSSQPGIVQTFCLFCSHNSLSFT